MKELFLVHSHDQVENSINKVHATKVIKIVKIFFQGKMFNLALSIDLSIYNFFKKSTCNL